jgi:hypothetical protein
MNVPGCSSFVRSIRPSLCILQEITDWTCRAVDEQQNECAFKFFYDAL